ncbi:MAG: prepilin-type N-terminal cleavage/methylation domain-containing protein [Planctomycetota bacterium]
MTASTRSRHRAAGSNPPRERRRGLTLVELLVAIAIISILATLLLGVAAQAGQTAREARTKSIVSRLHTLIVERMEEYREVRAELNQRTERDAPEPDWRDLLDNQGPDSFDVLNDQQRLALGRLFALRERQKMEMPDRWSDVACNAIDTAAPPNPPLVEPPNNYDYFPRYVSERPPLNRLYYRKLVEIYDRTNTLTGAVNTPAEILTNESAECLYLTVMNATADGEARGLFKATDSGDTDGDGALEFLDAWGQPIGWIRWPAGYESDLQWSFTRLVDQFENPPVGQTGEDVVQQTLDDNHDPLDRFRVDRTNLPSFSEPGAPQYEFATGENGRGWKLTPLIYSWGLDGGVGMWTGLQLGGSAEFQTANANSDPYVGDPTAAIPDLPLGTITDREAATDNITNHVIEAR